MSFFKNLAALILFILLSLILASQVIASNGSQDKIVLMWQVKKDVTDNDLSLLKSQGVNLIQNYSLVHWSDNDIKHFLDKLQKYSMGFVVSLNGFYKSGKGGSANINNFYRCSSFITKWKYHPVIKYWYTADEPMQHSISKRDQELAYNFVKNLDPQRKILVSQNLTSQRQYDNYFSEKAFDILDIHAYVNGPVSKRQVNLIDLIKRNRRGNYPIIITLRAYNGANGARRQDMSINSLQEQYDFFIKRGGLTNNYGFYGWQLSPNKGISQVEYIKKQFLQLNRQ